MRDQAAGPQAVGVRGERRQGEVYGFPKSPEKTELRGHNSQM